MPSLVCVFFLKIQVRFNLILFPLQKHQESKSLFPFIFSCAAFYPVTKLLFV